MKKTLKRPKDLGILMIVGGPGGSGASTIAKALAHHFELHYVYGGLLMRQLAKNKGYESLGTFLRSEDFKENHRKYDTAIDQKLIKMSFLSDVLIDSKVFAGLATLYQIPCTVRIWLHTDFETRVRRTMHKKGISSLSNKVPKQSEEYRKVADDLQRRYSNDMQRFRKLYGIEFDQQEKYNDIVIDSSKLDVSQTLELILKKLKDGRYIKST